MRKPSPPSFLEISCSIWASRSSSSNDVKSSMFCYKILDLGMKSSLLILLTLCSFFIFAQSTTPNTSPNAGLKLGKNHPHSNNADYIAKQGKMMFNYNDGEVEEPMVTAELFLHTSNMDFTITDERLVIFYDATHKKFTLNQLYLNDKDLIVEGSAVAPEMETPSDANIILKWNIEGKPLVVILWKAYFQSSLDYQPKHKKKKKKH